LGWTLQFDKLNCTVEIEACQLHVSLAAAHAALPLEMGERACDFRSPQGLGKYCEGEREQKDREQE